MRRLVDIKFCAWSECGAAASRARVLFGGIANQRITQIRDEVTNVFQALLL
jgi:hypothetical protein